MKQTATVTVDAPEPLVPGDPNEDEVAAALRSKLRFVAERLAEKGVRTLHIEHVATTGFSRTACGKETTPWWHRLKKRFFVDAIDERSNEPLGQYELCDRCMRASDASIWLRHSLGWHDEAITSDDEGTTYQWRDERGSRTCIFHHTDWSDVKQENPGQGDLLAGLETEPPAGEEQTT